MTSATISPVARSAIVASLVNHLQPVRSAKLRAASDHTLAVRLDDNDLLVSYRSLETKGLGKVKKRHKPIHWGTQTQAGLV